MFRLLLLVAPVLCGINTNYYTSGCVCDITTECDYLCCCDTSCVVPEPFRIALRCFPGRRTTSAIQQIATG